MSSGLNYKQVANVTRRTWDVEAYEKKAKARQKDAATASAADGSGRKKKRQTGTVQASVISSADYDDEETKEEFVPAAAGSVGPQGSKRAYLKARRGKVDLDSKVGTTEIVSAEAAATTSALKVEEQGGCVSVKDGVIKTGVGWHCKVCDCFLKDSHTYLDHINGRKHQRALGYTMRVERSTKDDLADRLARLTKQKEEDKRRAALDDPAASETNYSDLVKAKDEAARRRKEERRRRKQEKKKRLHQKPDDEEEEGEQEEEQQEEVVNPDMAAMMGFSGFGGGAKSR